MREIILKNQKLICIAVLPVFVIITGIFLTGIKYTIAASSLSAGTVTCQMVYLTWDREGQTWSYVYRNGSQIATVGNSGNFTDTGRTPGTTYSYYVVSGGVQSNTIQVTTLSSCESTPPTVSFSPTQNTTWAYHQTTIMTTNDNFGVYGTKICQTYSPSCDPDASSVGPYTTANGESYSENSVPIGLGISGYPYVEGQVNICAKPYDVSGNAGSIVCTGPFYKDSVAPTPNPPTVSGTPGGTYINVSMSEGSDGGSGLHSTPYGFSTNGSTYTWYASNSQTISGLSCNTDYTIYGKIRDAVNSWPTNAGSVVVNTGICLNAPTNLQTYQISSDLIDINWSAVSGASGYRIYRGGVLIGDIYGTAFGDTGLSPATSYSYYVKAYSGGTEGPQSSTLNVTTRTNVSNLSASGVVNAVNLSWTDPNRTGSGNTCVTEPYVYKDGSFIGVAGWNVTSYSYTNAGECGTSHNYTVLPRYFQCDYSTFTGYAYSNTASAASTCDSTPPTPNPPTVSASAASQTSVSASMSSGSDAGGLHSTPYGFSTNGSTYTWYASNAQTLTGLSCGTSYTVYGKIRDAAGNMTSAGTASVTTDNCTPGTPTMGSASASGQYAAYVSWTRNSPYTETMFQVYDSNDFAHGAFGAGSTGGTTTANLNCGTSYQFKVRAYVNTNGRTYYSNWSGLSNSITTDSCNNPPNTPTLSSPPNSSWTTSRQFCASVSDPNGDNVSAKFVIGGVTYSGWTVAGSGSSCYTHTSDLYGTSWYAYATDGSLNSGNTASWTAYVDATAPTPNPPTVSASAASQTSVSASMSSGSDATSGLHSTPYGFSTNGSTYTWYASNSQTLTGLSCGTSYTVYGKIRDTLSNQTSVGTASASTASCVNAPNTVSTVNTTEDPGRPTTQTTWSGSADKYLIYTYQPDTGYVFRADTSVSNATITGLKCPAIYTVYYVAYNTDTSLAGAVDATCSELNSMDSTYAANKKCASPVSSQVKILYCTRGFFGD